MYMVNMFVKSLFLSKIQKEVITDCGIRNISTNLKRPADAVFQIMLYSLSGLGLATIIAKKGFHLVSKCFCGTIFLGLLFRALAQYTTIKNLALSMERFEIDLL